MEAKKDRLVITITNLDRGVTSVHTARSTDGFWDAVNKHTRDEGCAKADFKSLDTKLARTKS